MRTDVGGGEHGGGGGDRSTGWRRQCSDTMGRRKKRWRGERKHMIAKGRECIRRERNENFKDSCCCRK